MWFNCPINGVILYELNLNPQKTIVGTKKCNN